VVSSKAVYTTNDQLIVTATLTSGANAVSGVSVRFSASPRTGGTAITGTATTDVYGRAIFKYRFNRKRDRLSIYDLTATAGLNGSTVIGTSLFELR
jgi:hypothetical protein